MCVFGMVVQSQFKRAFAWGILFVEMKANFDHSPLFGKQEVFHNMADLEDYYDEK
jgi:hypothetical protein